MEECYLGDSGTYEGDPRDAEIARLRHACSKQDHEIQQVLGKALGFPRYCDDKQAFPDATEADGVCTGEHTAETLADMAAARIQRLTEQSERRRALLEEIQWAGKGYNADTCPKCGGWSEEGHDENCALARELADKPETKEAKHEG